MGKIWQSDTNSRIVDNDFGKECRKMIDEELITI